MKRSVPDLVCDTLVSLRRWACPHASRQLRWPQPAQVDADEQRQGEFTSIDLVRTPSLSRNGLHLVEQVHLTAVACLVVQSVEDRRADSAFWIAR